MKWAFRIQHKYKTAMLFMVVVVTILACSFLESWYMSQMNNSVTSIYKDRLIPEVELFHINDNMHSRRLILEKYLLSPQNYDKHEVSAQLNRHQTRIDSIVRNYETTYLVASESEALGRFKETIKDYNNLEQAFLGSVPTNNFLTAYQTDMEPVFSQVHSELLQLSSIQSTVGKELYKGSELAQGSANAIGYLQIAMVVIITLAVQALLLNSKPVLPKKLQKYHWN